MSSESKEGESERQGGSRAGGRAFQLWPSRAHADEADAISKEQPRPARFSLLGAD